MYRTKLPQDRSRITASAGRTPLDSRSWLQNSRPPPRLPHRRHSRGSEEPFRYTRIDAAVRRSGPGRDRAASGEQDRPGDRIRLAVEGGCTRPANRCEATRKSTNLAGLMSTGWSSGTADEQAATSPPARRIPGASTCAPRPPCSDAAGPPTALDVYAQVNTSDEPQKYGLSPDDVADSRPAHRFPAARPRTDDPGGSVTTQLVRACFVRLRGCATGSWRPPRNCWAAQA